VEVIAMSRYSSIHAQSATNSQRSRIDRRRLRHIITMAAASRGRRIVDWYITMRPWDHWVPSTITDGSMDWPAVASSVNATATAATPAQVARMAARAEPCRNQAGRPGAGIAA